MRKRRTYDGNWRRVQAIMALVVVLFLVATTSPVFAGLADSDQEPDNKPQAMAPLTRILERLEAVIEPLQEMKFPVLEAQLEEILALLDKLNQEWGTPPQSGEDKPPIREKLVKLDLMLHRLVFVLEGIVERADVAPRHLPKREQAQGALEDLKHWIDGYIASATRRMDRIEAREFERTAKALLGEVGKRFNRMVHRAKEYQPEKARLEILLGRIEALLADLDRFIIRSFGRPPTDRPHPQGP